MLSFRSMSMYMRSKSAKRINIFTCGRTVAVQSRQLSCLWFAIHPPLGLLIVRQARQTMHLTHVTDHHNNMHQRATRSKNNNFKLHHLRNRIVLCHIIRRGPPKHNILGPHCTEHCTFDTASRANSYHSTRTIINSEVK